MCICIFLVSLCDTLCISGIIPDMMWCSVSMPRAHYFPLITHTTCSFYRASHHFQSCATFADNVCCLVQKFTSDNIHVVDEQKSETESVKLGYGRYHNKNRCESLRSCVWSPFGLHIMPACPWGGGPVLENNSSYSCSPKDLCFRWNISKLQKLGKNLTIPSRLWS